MRVLLEFGGEAVRGGDERGEGLRLGEGVPRGRRDAQLGLRPGAVQGPGRSHGAAHVVATLDDDAGDAVLGEYPGAVEELTVLHPPAVGEEVVLDAGEGDSESRVLGLVDVGLVSQERGGRGLPGGPRDRRRAVDRGVRTGQELVVTLDVASRADAVAR